MSEDSLFFEFATKGGWVINMPGLANMLEMSDEQILQDGKNEYSVWKNFDITKYPPDLRKRLAKRLKIIQYEKEIEVFNREMEKLTTMKKGIEGKIDKLLTVSDDNGKTE